MRHYLSYEGTSPGLGLEGGLQEPSHGQTAPRTLRWHCCHLASSPQGCSQALPRKAAQTRGRQAELQWLSACLTPPHPSPSRQGPGASVLWQQAGLTSGPSSKPLLFSPAEPHPGARTPALSILGLWSHPHCSPCFWAAKAPPREGGSRAGGQAQFCPTGLQFLWGNQSMYKLCLTLSQDSVVSAASLHWTRRFRKLKRSGFHSPVPRGPGSCHQSMCEPSRSLEATLIQNLKYVRKREK